jgi:hypothetical protein
VPVNLNEELAVASEIFCGGMLILLRQYDELYLPLFDVPPHPINNLLI